MTKLLDPAVASARRLSPEAQDEIARILLQLAGEEDQQVLLSKAEQAAIAKSKDAAERGEFASDEQVSGVWSKYGL